MEDDNTPMWRGYSEVTPTADGLGDQPPSFQQVTQVLQMLEDVATERTFAMCDRCGRNNLDDGVEVFCVGWDSSHAGFGLCTECKVLPFSVNDRGEFVPLDLPGSADASALEIALANISRACDGPFSEDSSPARDLWLKATAASRHAQRVAATMEAARVAAALWKLGKGPFAAALALLVDLLGDGGPLGLGNGTSSRRYPFSRLGSGRRQANDGASYASAGAEAFKRLLSLASSSEEHEDYWLHSHVVLAHDPDCGVIAKLFGANPDNGLDDPKWDVLVPREVYRVLAGRALLASTNSPSCYWHDEKVKFDLTPDQAKDWYEACVGTPRIDTQGVLGVVARLPGDDW